MPDPIYVLAQHKKQVELFLGEFKAAKVGDKFTRDESTSHAGEWTIIKTFCPPDQLLIQSISTLIGERSAQRLFGIFKTSVL